MNIKKIASPFQKVLLARRLCVGCTHPLDKGDRMLKITETRTIVQCKCRRMYVLDQELGSYRRATFEEERLLIERKNK